MPANQSEDGRPGVRFGFLYGIAVSLLIEFGMLKFFLAHPGFFTRVEDYIQFGLASLFALLFAVIGARYLFLLVSDLRR